MASALTENTSRSLVGNDYLVATGMLITSPVTGVEFCGTNTIKWTCSDLRILL